MICVGDGVFESISLTREIYYVFLIKNVLLSKQIENAKWILAIGLSVNKMGIF